MEDEDIKVLEELINAAKEFNQYNGNKYYRAIENLIQRNKELKKQLQDIYENFCKFNWKESNGEQVYYQLKELYESIYRNQEGDK